MTNNVWTVGNPNVYDRLLSEGVIHKAPGGWIWRSEADAIAFLESVDYKWTFDNTVVPLTPYRLEVDVSFDELAGPVDENNIHLLKEGYTAIIQKRLINA